MRNKINRDTCKLVWHLQNQLNGKRFDVYFNNNEWILKTKKYSCAL